jgi:hypothetical protein
MREPKSVLEENRKAMKRGKRPGSPKTGGRKKGSKNKRTRELLEKAEAGGQSAIDYMLEVMRDNKNDTSLRLDAAKAVAPYLHARRAPEDRGGNTVPAMIYVHPRSRGAGMMTCPEITYKDFATLARNPAIQSNPWRIDSEGRS